MDGTDRRTAVSMPAADGLFGQSRRVGEYRGAAEPLELFASAGRQQGAWIADGCAGVAGDGLFERCEGGAGSRRAAFPGWRDWTGDGRNASEGTGKSASVAGEAG